jgi:PAS domain S-box-containing protein
MKKRKQNFQKTKNYEHMLVEGEERYRTLFNLSPGGFIFEDMDGNIIDVNPALCNWLGYSREELIGKNVHLLAHPEHTPDVEENLTQLNHGKLLKHNVKSIRKDGTACYMDLIETKISLPDGSQGILSVAKDITDQKLAEEERLQKERMKSIIEIAGAVCHEMNQPLTVLTVISDLLLMNEFDRDETKVKLKTIKDQIKRMSKMTHKLMNLTRYETREYLKGSKIIDIDKSAK